MFFWASIVPYYEARLQHYESITLGRCDEKELLAAAQEGSALRKFIADLVEEGYTDVEALLRGRINAVERLQRFLGAALEILGPPSERQRFYLIRKPIRVQIPPVTRAFAGAPEIGLHDYLDCLNVRSDDPVDISDCFDDPRQMHHRQRQTRRVMTEMAGFLRWIDDWLQAHPGTVHACLPQTVGFAAGQRIAGIHRKRRARLFHPDPIDSQRPGGRQAALYHSAVAV